MRNSIHRYCQADSSHRFKIEQVHRSTIATGSNWMVCVFVVEFKRIEWFWVIGHTFKHLLIMCAFFMGFVHCSICTGIERNEFGFCCFLSLCGSLVWKLTQNYRYYCNSIGRICNLLSIDSVARFSIGSRAIYSPDDKAYINLNVTNAPKGIYSLTVIPEVTSTGVQRTYGLHVDSEFDRRLLKNCTIDSIGGPINTPIDVTNGKCVQDAIAIRKFVSTITVQMGHISNFNIFNLDSFVLIWRNHAIFNSVESTVVLVRTVKRFVQIEIPLVCCRCSVQFVYFIVKTS